MEGGGWVGVKGAKGKGRRKEGGDKKGGRGMWRTDKGDRER